MQQIIGAKKGQQASKPYIMPDNMQSGNEVGIIYGLGEGEILGLVDGGKSIYLDGTPLINDNGGENFGGVSWEMRTGTIDQTHLHGFPAVENETSVNVELRHDRAFVRQVRNTKLSAVVIRLGFGAIFTAKDNGDRVGHTIEYAVDVQTDGGVWREVLATKFSGKASQGYKRSHRIDLPTAKNNWTIRVRRLTANKDSEMVGDRMTIDALTEVIDAKLRYPCTALIGLRFNAESFNNIPKFAAECHGMIIQVPSNYDPVARTYSGLWDGTFKLAYSNNPAWIYYDLCTARRYALGDRLIGHLDKWSLYRVAQYCDEMVDDGRGGREPRYACNVYLQQREDAYKILQNIAGIFHALTYWDGEQIIVDADLPKDVLYTFSRANIIGDFEYSGTANYARHTQIKVAYDDPDNEYKTTYEIVPDLQAIAKYGVKTLDMSAFGCTSQAQAIRLGKWALLSEALETQTVTFSVGLDGYLPHVGSVIAVSDHVLAGRDNGGRVQAIDGNIITLDRAITKPLASGDMLMINGNDGVTETRPITAINGNKITVQTAFERAEVDAVWAMDSADLQTLKLRVMSIVQSEPAKFTVTGVEYNPDKFAAAEIDIRALPKPVSVIPTAVISAPEAVTISQSVRVEQGVSITKLSIDWSQVIGAVAYRVEWRKDGDDSAWMALPKTASQSIDIDNVYDGNYQARVRAIDAFDNESLAMTSQLTPITGKIGKPPRPARLYAKGGLFSMELGWIFNAGSDDTAYTEIQVSPDGRSNIATLGTFAYPTNKHEITGLQGNLTQHYRARIVDKLGNVSDWTDWVSGTTSADAEKVLEILSGQISESHLDQTLRTPIAKIGGIESGLALITPKVTSLESSIVAVNSNLSSLNANMTVTKADIAKAKTDLSTAISNITTERNRITSTIRDITALQSANNAKTQEIASLAQTVGSHTSSIRELGITTGDLSQKYTALKTTSDTANAEITTIKQTQAGQALSVERLGARFDNLAVGGRNLLLGSGTTISNASYLLKVYPITQAPSDGDDMVITIWGELGADRQRFMAFNSGGMVALAGSIAQVTQGIYQAKFKWVSSRADGSNKVNNSTLNIYQFTSSGTSQSRIDKIKLEIGNIATDWTPAPEDIDAQFVQTNASIATMQQTLSNADNALSQRIDTLDAGYKTADSAINASLTVEQQARASADTALSSRITALDAAYKSADTQTNARIGTLEQSITDKDSAMSRRVDNLQASYNTLNSSKASTASVAAETQARTTADTALSQRIDSLSSDYQGNKASVASQLKTLTDKDTATASQISQLTANVSTAQNTANTANDKADTATTKADNAQSTASNALNRANTANSAITAEQKARADADSSLASRITALDTAYKKSDTDITARLAREETARASGDNANAQALRTLESTVNGIGGRVGISEGKIANLERTTSDLNGAIATAQSQLNARFDSLAVGGRNLLKNSNPNIANANYGHRFELTIAPNVGDDVIVTIWGDMGADRTGIGVYNTHGFTELFKLTKIADGVYQGKGKWRKPVRNGQELTPNDTHLNVYFYPNSATGTNRIDKIKLEKGNIATDWTPAPEDIDTAITQANANLDEFKRTEVLANNALSQRIDSLNTSLGTKANAVALDNLTTRVSQVDGKLTAEANKIGTLQTTVQGQTASIQQHAQSLNGLNAQYTVKVQTGGIVAGIGLMSSNGVSDFAVRADKFYIAPPTGTNKGVLPFVVKTTPSVVNGVTVPAGTYINNAFIANGSIDIAKINKASIQSLSALSAKIGHFKSANTGARLEIKDGVLLVYDSNNRLRVRLGVW